ncbi:thioesterase family protein [soil metagenome]
MPLLKPGDTKIYEKEVLPGDLASFHNKLVHEVYSTFALARDMEWASRLLILDILKEGEEGIGMGLQVKHINPAFLGQKIIIEAVVKKFRNNILNCEVTVRFGNKIIATGFTQQKIIDKNKLNELFKSKMS